MKLYIAGIIVGIIHLVLTISRPEVWNGLNLLTLVAAVTLMAIPAVRHYQENTPR